MNAPVPILMLTGYLGAGKTTLLNHLLGLQGIREKHLALIINEFGTLGVDGQLVDSGRHPKYELNRGSVFCICIKTDFIRTLEAIAGDGKTELVIVEATGVADPCDLGQIIETPLLTRSFVTWANLCVVDAVGFTQAAAFLKAAVRQVSWADGLLINKDDLAPQDDIMALQRILHDLNPRAPQLVTRHGRITPGFLEGLRHTVRLAPPAEAPPDKLVSASLQTDRTVNRRLFLGAVAGLEGRLLRLKGTVRFEDGTRFVEVVNGRLTEKSPPADKTETAFVAIGWDLTRDALMAAFTPSWSP